MDNNNNNQKFSDEDLEVCTEVQSKFFEFYQTNPEMFTKEDIEMVKNDIWWTVRFVKFNKRNVKKSVKHMIEAFKWRKSFGIRDRDLKDLPLEFAQAGALFPYGEDFRGHPVVYMRVKVYRKIQELNIFFQQFVAGIINYIDNKAGSRGFALVFDVTGMSMTNVDFDFLQFLIQLFQQYYPCGLRYSMLYNVPRIIRPIWSTAKMFMGGGDKLVVFCNTEELLQRIPKDQLPLFLGGECRVDFTNLEETRDCPSVRELAPKFGFTDAEVDKFYNMLKHNLDEAQLLFKGQPLPNQGQS